MGVHWGVAVALQNKTYIDQNKETSKVLCVLLDCILVEPNITKGLQNV